MYHDVSHLKGLSYTALIASVGSKTEIHYQCHSRTS
jgi:hypothetical protein